MQQHFLKTFVAAALLVGMITACHDKSGVPQAPSANKVASEPSSFAQKLDSEPTEYKGMVLADFSELVEREGSTVVSIFAIRNDGRNELNSYLDSIPIEEDPFAEYYRRMLPDNFSPPAPPKEQNDDHNYGSGMIISQDGYILTNSHVVDNANTIKVALNDKREFKATLIGLDRKTDVALLKINANDLPTVKIGKSEELKPGMPVVAIGAPFGFENSVTSGVVSAVGRNVPNDNFMPFIQTDVSINPGNSGGPLFNVKGQVVGINSQIYSKNGGFMGISFAIPINVAMNVAEQLKNTGKVQRSQLGVVVQDVSYELSKVLGLDNAHGAIVTEVKPNSPAAQHGLQVGDVIRSVNSMPVVSNVNLPMLISSVRVGQEANLGIWRKGQNLNLSIKLAPASDELSATGSFNLEEIMSPPVVLSNQGAGFDVPSLGLLLSAEEAGLTVSRATGLAAEAGMQRGDVILEVGNVPVKDQASFNEALKRSDKKVLLLTKRLNSNVAFIAFILP